MAADGHSNGRAAPFLRIRFRPNSEKRFCFETQKPFINFLFHASWDLNKHIRCRNVVSTIFSDLSLSPIHTHALTLSFIYTHVNKHTQPLSFTHTCTHPHSLSLTHTNTHPHTLSFTHTQAYKLFPSFPILSLSLPFSLIHLNTHSLTKSVCYLIKNL